jgi:hypothetical protein
VRAAKATFYQERAYEALLERAPPGVPPEEIAALRAWLPEGRVNLKRQDALEMLTAMRTFLDADPPPKQVAYNFEHTTLWDNAVAACEKQEAEAAPEDAIAAELRMDPDTGEAARRAGLWRMLALHECERRGIDATVQERRRIRAEFRRRHSLGSAAELDQWLADNHLDREGFDRLMADEARLDKLAAALGAAGASHSLDYLRINDRYAALAARANDKERSLESLPAAASPPEDSALLQAMVWYFEDRLGREIPTDIDTWARAVGYADATSFRRAVWREYLYRR